MSYLQTLLTVVTCLLLLIAICSYIGDDDVVYAYLQRRPTPQEALRRIRWVILKAVTSIYGGVVLATPILGLLTTSFPIAPAGNVAVFIKFAGMGLVCLSLGVLQNGIRTVRGRPRRPLIDSVVWQRSSGKFGRK